MAKTTKKDKEVSLSDVLWNCRNALRGVGSTEKNRDAVIGLAFLKFAGDKFEKRREQIKAQILGLLTSARFPWLTITKIYERPENIFSDFNYDYTNNQFLMSPYAGLRIDGEMKVRVPCYIPPKPEE